MNKLQSLGWEVINTIYKLKKISEVEDFLHPIEGVNWDKVNDIMKLHTDLRFYLTQIIAEGPIDLPVTNAQLTL